MNKPSESINFFLRAINRRGQVGALTPSSLSLASHVARTTLKHATTKAPIIELGPGTGSITELLYPYLTSVVEIDSRFCSLLAGKFPNLTVMQGSAIDFLERLEKPTYLISSIPIIGNRDAGAYLNSIRMATQRRMILGITTYTYGRRSPLASTGLRVSANPERVWRNLPPAKIWSYEP